MEHQTIIQGDCLQEMRQMADCSITHILTDPPYGISFMGKEWDHGIPGIEFWREALRIAMPGSMLLAFGGTRTYHRLACAIEDAGWEIRDQIVYLYGQGFPKSHNFGRQLGGEWEGFGTALKPSFEPIIVAMKPLDGTFKQNAEKWGVAGINIDECRIETVPRTTHKDGNYKGKDADGNIYSLGYKEGHFTPPPLGRWPANLILDDIAGALLDEQTGISISKKGSGRPKECDGYKGKLKSQPGQLFGHCDSGGASRFFYCAKASSAERNAGLEGMPIIKCGTGALRDCGRGKTAPNSHPTVKPIKLMEYLLKLITPPNGGIVLDPFCGSGSTLVAARNLGINAIGIELQEEYCEIARKRIEHYQKKVGGEDGTSK